jgi:hypothetical protein
MLLCCPEGKCENAFQWVKGRLGKVRGRLMGKNPLNQEAQMVCMKHRDAMFMLAYGQKYGWECVSIMMMNCVCMCMKA